MKSTIFRLLGAIVVLSMVVPMLGVAPVMARPEAPPTFEAVEVDSFVELGKEGVYIVLLKDAPLATYAGGVPGLAATNPMATGTQKLDAKSPASVAYLDYLAKAQAQFIANAEQALDRSVDVLYQYAAALNGMAVHLTVAEAEKLAALPEVAYVERDFDRQIETDAGPGWMGVYSVWNGSSSGGTDIMGEGMVIGVIDTGINLGHPSFAEVGPTDGYAHVNPLGTGVFLGACATDPGLYVCNDKLIGAYDYVDIRGNESDGPLDQHSHGSHTSSTSAGNILEDAVITLSNGYVITRTISGMAPHANIIMYDTCDTAGCPNSATNAAINQAVLDGVDVINYSIGGGPADPWQDTNGQAYLAARTAGVFVATSAGNDGAAPGTVGSPANAPWLLSVGNASHNRTFENMLTFTGGDSTLADIEGRSVTGGYGPEPIVHAKNYTSTTTASDALCGAPFAPGTWSGEIVVCDRGAFALVDKAANVAAGGAGGIIIANAVANGPQIYAMDFEIPGSHIDYTGAEALRTWLDAGTGHMATISPGEVVLDDTYGDRMSPSSSRGPNLPVLDVIKPSVIAPGSDILAAYRAGNDIGFMSGTSMASPHTAGVALLIRSAHPTWTPAEVQSAMESTALYAPIYKENWTTVAVPFDYGAGRPYAEYAVKAGFVLGETEANYTDADPLAGGDPSTLNLTSLGQDQCLVSCTWTRELKSTMTEAVTWTVSGSGEMGITVEPSSFTLPAGGTQVVTVTADVTGQPYGEWLFGRVEFTPDSTDTVPAHFTVAANPSAGILPEQVDFETRRDTGAKTLMNLAVAESPELTVEVFGLVSPMMAWDYIPQHPDVGVDFPDIFFGFDEVSVSSVSVPAGAKRLSVKIDYTWSPDLDMLVLPDTDGDGMPELSDLTGEECQSASGGAMESCDILEPSAGTWFIMVLNYTESAMAGPMGDYTRLSYAVVTGTDVGNMTITHPVSVTEATPFNMTILWDEPTMMAGDTWYGAFSIGTDAANPGNIMGVIPVTIHRITDDVVKDASAVKEGGEITVTYELTAQPNVTGEDYTLTLTDTIPAGLTYVDGSVTGGAVVSGNQVTWSGMMDSTYSYVVTDNIVDPTCDTPWGGYMDWKLYGFSANAGISGDTAYWTAFSTYGGFDYYGKHYDMGLSFADDGFAMLDPAANYGGEPWTNQMIPDSDQPNNVIAAFWKDLEIVYDAATNKGVTLVGTGPGGVAVVEYDDVQPFEGDGSVHYDVELFMWTSAGPGPEIMFAYDNVVGPVDDVTVGVEDKDGALATLYAYNETNSIADGLVICIDYVGPEPRTITYQATVDAPMAMDMFTNTVQHDTDALNTMVETGSRTIKVNYPPAIDKSVYPASVSVHGDVVTYTVAMQNPNIYPLEGVTMTDQLPPLITFENWVIQGGATFTAPDLIEWTGTLSAESWKYISFAAATSKDTHTLLIDIVNTAYMGYEGVEYSDTVSFSLLHKIYMPLIFKNYP